MKARTDKNSVLQPITERQTTWLYYSGRTVSRPTPETMIRTLSRVDLNLLLALDTLLRERSVTRAAATLGLSQPAVSGSLSKLRRYFNDQLLSRVGNSYELTPLASTLIGRTSRALAAVEQVFGGPEEFDPTTSRREFDLYLSDYAASVLAAHLTRLVQAEAPAIQLRIQQLNPKVVEDAHTVLREHDGIVVPPGFINDLPHIDLFRDTYVVLASVDNPAVNEDLTIDDLLKMPMVVPFKESTGSHTAVRELRMAGLEPTIDTITESFLIVPFLVAGTDRISLVPSLLARRFAPMGEVRSVPCPHPVSDLVDALWWHPVYDDDPAHRWFRDLIVRAAAEVK